MGRCLFGPRPRIVSLRGDACPGTCRNGNHCEVAIVIIPTSCCSQSSQRGEHSAWRQLSMDGRTGSCCNLGFSTSRKCWPRCRPMGLWMRSIRFHCSYLILNSRLPDAMATRIRMLSVLQALQLSSAAERNEVRRTGEWRRRTTCWVHHHRRHRCHHHHWAA